MDAVSPASGGRKVLHNELRWESKGLVPGPRPCKSCISL